MVAGVHYPQGFGTVFGHVGPFVAHFGPFRPLRASVGLF